MAVAALAAVALVATAPKAAAQAPVIKLTETNRVSATGYCRFAYEIKLPAREYTRIKRDTPNMAVLLRRLGLGREHWYAVEGVKGEWIDGESTVRVEFTTRGLARVGKDQNREIPIAEDVQTELVAVTDNVTVLTQALNTDLGLATSTIRVQLPLGADGVKALKSPARLAYRLPAPPTGTDPRAEFDVDARPQVMTSLAKPMSNRKFSALWTARSVFRNTGDQVLRDYKVRFRLAEYANTWRPWSGTPVVVPGQTVVDPYFPILDMDKITRITGTTRAAIEVQYQYRRADGSLVEEAETKEIEFLSRNHVYYSSLSAGERIDWYDGFNLSPVILPAFVSHHDPVVQQAAGWVCQQAGGRGRRCRTRRP